MQASASRMTLSPEWRRQHRPWYTAQRNAHRPALRAGGVPQHPQCVV